jgi:hypothetical protein
MSALAALGCAAEYEAEVCPTVRVGDLVVTELRGPGADLDRDWIELANVSGGALDLRGLHLRLRNLDGSGEDTIIVRRALPVAAGDAVVLGGYDQRAQPAHIDYGWQPDFTTASGSVVASKHLPEGGVLDVLACDVLIDRVQWPSLPSDGTRSLGLTPPDAAGNDNAAAWCDVASTPGAGNSPCP